MLELIDAFTDQATRIGAVVLRTSVADAPRVACDALRANGCASVALSDDLSDRDGLVDALSARAIQISASGDLWPTRRADGGISQARLGVAETGSVLLHSSSQDRRVELCVDHHLVLLDSRQLVATLDRAFVELRSIASRPPAYASLVSGPSRSADIERALTVGVHGPRTFTVLLLEDLP